MAGDGAVVGIGALHHEGDGGAVVHVHHVADDPQVLQGDVVRQRVAADDGDADPLADGGAQIRVGDPVDLAAHAAVTEHGGLQHELAVRRLGGEGGGGEQAEGGGREQQRAAGTRGGAGTSVQRRDQDGVHDRKKLW